MKSKLKEPSRVNVVPKDVRILRHEFFGPLDLNDFLDNTNQVVREVRKETSDKETFLALCEVKGLKISHPETFLRIYWYKNVDKNVHKREWKENKNNKLNEEKK